MKPLFCILFRTSLISWHRMEEFFIQNHYKTFRDSDHAIHHFKTYKDYMWEELNVKFNELMFGNTMFFEKNFFGSTLHQQIDPLRKNISHVSSGLSCGIGVTGGSLQVKFKVLHRSQISHFVF